MWLVRGSLKNPYAVSVFALLLLVLGTVALAMIPIDILPVFRSPGVMVLTFYSGMPAGAIDKTITSRMERWCSQATGVTKVESKSMVGVSIVRIYFRDDVEPGSALTEVNSLSMSAMQYLPPGTLPPVIRPFDPTATLPLCLLSVSSPDGQLGETALSDLARVEIRNYLGGLAGVIAPTAFGGKERAVMVYVRPNDMEARKMSPLDVVRSIRDYNAMISAGTAKFGDEEVQLDTNALVNQVHELDDIPVHSKDDQQVYLRDIGKAEDGNRIQTALVRINGKPQVYVPIFRQQGASSLAVVNQVKESVPALTKLSPDGVNLDVVMDQSVYVRSSIESLFHEGLMGAGLAAVMIVLFLGNFRLTFIAVLSIPLAVMGALAAMLGSGNTINAMTLGGLALAIGPLVDNAIVVLENTHRHLGMGKLPAQAAEEGASEVAQPAMVATLSTIIVLVPLAFMPGMGKFLFRPLALSVTFAMIISLFLALTFVPTRCAAWLRPHATHSSRGFFHLIDLLLTQLTKAYSGLLAVALKARLITLTLVASLFAATMTLIPHIGREFFPQSDTGQLTIYVRCPTGLRIERTNERLDAFETFVREMIPPQEIRMIVSELGVTPNWSAAYTANSGPQDSVVKIQLTDERTHSVQEYAALIREEFQLRQQQNPAFADLRISFDTGGMIAAALNYGATSPLEVQIVGGSQQNALRIARDLRDKATGIPGTADVRVMQRFDYPQLIIEVDRQKASLMGLDVFEIINNVTTALNSSVTVNKNFWIDPKSGNQYWVGVQYPEESANDLETVKNISLKSKHGGDLVKLGTLVHFRRVESSPAEITHDNLASVISVMVNVQGRDLGGVAHDVEQLVKQIEPELPRGMTIRMSGEYQRMNEAFGNLGIGLVLAAVLVYLIMVAQFKSFLSPFVIMFTVPLGLIGVVLTLYLTHTTINVQSLMGVIFMVGIVVANGTLLVDFANRMRENGATVREAIAQAAKVRLRPILMTFLATFLGLLPMALGGRGSEANAPLARAVVGGLLSSTFLTLFVVPILYTLLNRDAKPAVVSSEVPS
ncbi:MAG TPA: efflux RND transporter permease subunit [Gemmatales bacterium]|nr:efflux RND transporter permease subunit [Gemmatales bacterium]